ncbi:hypothetical protein [Streptosporangium lutulentum]|uniref:Lipoprotein n=1 Tax=Streptosporangium lutulentum TaxID=1461250 RepID=A0ABT9QJU9_9ACTN|nr:hypothetical protein [Streptosporangium lutulentum]MDP9847035.1 hypothetical protein [Streptosporangium lutulentum]
MRASWFAPVAGVILLAGCGQGGALVAPGSPDVDMRAVAERWRATGLSEEWVRGFVPQEALTVLGKDVRFTGRSKLAFLAGKWERHADLPDGAPSHGEIRWRDGTTMTSPMLRASAAYEQMSVPNPHQKCAPGECGLLTVIGARLGEVRIQTSRGPAVVPAWQFSVRDVPGTFSRVAIAPTARSSLPPALGAAEVNGYRPGEGTTVRLEYMSGSCDEPQGVRSFETDDLVVVDLDVETAEGACTAVGLVGTTEVTLAKPLGDRIMLDASSGLPVPYGVERFPAVPPPDASLSSPTPDISLLSPTPDASLPSPAPLSPTPDASLPRHAPLPPWSPSPG